MTHPRVILARCNGATYRVARVFGRGRAFSAWLQLRFCLTGRTGRYRISLTPATR